MKAVGTVPLQSIVMDFTYLYNKQKLHYFRQFLRLCQGS